MATLNARNTADRWWHRRPLLVRQLVDLMPEVIGLQEVRRIPSQARTIARRAAAGSGLPPPLFDLHCTGKTGWWQLWEGLAVLSRLPVLERERISLHGQHRVAQRVVVRLPGGDLLGFCNAHLSSLRDEAVRERQARRLLDWMDERPELPQVLVGDFNAGPARPSIRLLKERLASAYEAVHGREPPKTAPTPLRVGATGPGAVLDYVFVNPLVQVHAARVAFDEVTADERPLVASDHYGLVATVSVRRTR